MKKIRLPFFIGILLFLISCSDKTKSVNAASGDTLKGEIQLSGAFALYPMVIKWADEFNKLHPNVKIDISGGGAGKGMTDVLAGVVDLGMISRDIYPEEEKKGAYAISVIKDAVIITTNSRNPEIEAITKIGLKRETAQQLWNSEIVTWGQALNIESKIPVHVFTRSDACGAAETFAKWLNKKQEQIKAIAVFGDPGISSAIQKDKVGLGYNNIAYVYDKDTKRPFESLTVVPIDFNENGKIDAEEDFYQNTEQLSKAIIDGRYPAPLARHLYIVAKGKPDKAEVIAFLNYILTEGQKFAEETGYVALSEAETSVEIDKLK